MAAIFDSDDVTAIKDAIMTAIANGGYASVSFGGRQVQLYSLDQLRALLAYAQGDIATEATSGGLRIRQMVPGGCG